MISEAELAEEERLLSETARPKKTLGDRTLTVAGLGIAAFAAFFPWYVFLHPAEFGVKPIGLNAERDLPERPGRNLVSVSPLAITDLEDGAAPPAEFDPISTATVPKLGDEVKGAPNSAEPPSQPFPSSAFRLLHVANGRALIEDNRGMYIVRIGSILPDNSRLATLEKRGSDWVIVTSNGDVVGR